MYGQFSRRTRVLLLLGFNLLLLALIGLAGELLVRSQYDRVEQITGVAAWRQGRWKDLTYHWDRYHPRFGWTNLAGYRSGSEVPFRVSINGQGLRGRRDYSPAPAAGVTRIAMFGDSTMFGEEVHDGETVPAHLERLLPGIEALNFGVHGYGLGQMTLRLEEEGFTLAPHHVVLMILVPHDLLRVPVRRFVHEKPVFYLDQGGLRLGNVPVPEASHQPWAIRHSFLAAWLLGRPRQPPGVRLLSRHAALTRALVGRVKAACDRRGVGLTVVAIASARYLASLETKPRARLVSGRLRAAVAASGVELLDLFPFLAAAHRRHGDALVARHGHWSARGNALIAAEIARYLKNKLSESNGLQAHLRKETAPPEK